MPKVALQRLQVMLLMQKDAVLRLLVVLLTLKVVELVLVAIMVLMQKAIALRLLDVSAHMPKEIAQ